jgi:hypothetical protein
VTLEGNATVGSGTDAESSTEPASGVDERIVRYFKQRLRRACAAAGDEAFEDGVETHFSREIVNCLQQGHGSAVEALDSMLTDPHLSPDLAGEALRWVGQHAEKSTRSHRRGLLERALRNGHPEVRDGAILGLSFMDDPSSIAAVERAILDEDSENLRQDLRQLLSQLEQTKRCPLSSEA